MITTLEDYKVVPYTIPEQTGEGAEDAVTPFIDRVEQDNLVALLGFPFFDALASGIAALPDVWDEEAEYVLDDLVRKGSVIYKALGIVAAGVEPSANPGDWEVQPDNKWLKLLEGNNYVWQEDGRQYKWVGLHLALVPMVYAEYLTYFTTFQTSVGTTVPMVENGEGVSPAPTIARSWNQYRKLVCRGTEYLGSCLNCCSGKDTLIGYLLTNAASFDAEVLAAGWGTFKEYLNSNFKAPASRNEFNL